MTSWSFRTKKAPLVAVDIGSHKMACVIADVSDQDKGLRILGASSCVSKGIRTGAVTDMPVASDALSDCVREAERMAGLHAEEIWLAFSAGHVCSHTQKEQVSLKGRSVCNDDIWTALDQGRVHCRAEHKSIRTGEHFLVHTIPTSYVLDRCMGIKDPRNLRGWTLGVKLHVVSAYLGAFKNLLTCVRRCHLEVCGWVIEPYASGLAVLTEEEMELGSLVIDFGAGVTSAAIFSGEALLFACAVPLGGHSITQDIASCLSISRAEAERLKNLRGHAISLNREGGQVLEPALALGETDSGRRHSVDCAKMDEIIHTRLQEILELLKHAIAASGYAARSGFHTVITGGCIDLLGLQDLTSQILDRKVRVGNPRSTFQILDRKVRLDYPQHSPDVTDFFRSPGTSAVLGTLRYALEEIAARVVRPSSSRIMRLGRWMKTHFWKECV